MQGVLAKLGPSLQELHLVSCELTAADAAVLGTRVSLVDSTVLGSLGTLVVFLSPQEGWFLRSPDSRCWTFPVTLCWHTRLMVALLGSWRSPCLRLWACARSGCRPVVSPWTPSRTWVPFLLFWIFCALCWSKGCYCNRMFGASSPLLVLQVVRSAPSPPSESWTCPVTRVWLEA